ncbi:lipid-transfer protein [Thermodesulfobacteriota bacterium]
MRELAIIGVGMSHFGIYPNKSFEEIGTEAILEALTDAGLKWKDIQIMGCSVSHWHGLSGLLAGNLIGATLGETGIPIFNCSNVCGTGAVVFNNVCAQISSGNYDIGIAVGVDKVPGGFFPAVMSPDPKDVDAVRFHMVGMPNPGFWAIDATRRMHDIGTTHEDYARIKVKNSKHGALNPKARYRKEYTMEDVLNSPMVTYPFRLYEICATSDGAAAAIVCSMDIAKRFTSRPIKVAATRTVTRMFGDACMGGTYFSTQAVPVSASLKEWRAASKAAYEDAGVGPEDLDFAEVADNTPWHELAFYEVIGLCKEGEAEQLLADGMTQIGGKIPVCPSGGFSSFGEATGAMGIFQLYETVRQLRDQCGARQVNGAKVGYCHVQGNLGNTGVTILVK